MRRGSEGRASITTNWEGGVLDLVIRSLQDLVLAANSLCSRTFGLKRNGDKISRRVNLGDLWASLKGTCHISLRIDKVLSDVDTVQRLFWNWSGGLLSTTIVSRCNWDISLQLECLV